MFAVIFEAKTSPEHQQQYLDIAAELRPLLQDIDGFISIERFSSLNEEGKILSLSFWRDETAIAQWRQMEIHRAAQQQAREGIFEHYRIRVAEVCRDYSQRPPARSRWLEVTAESRSFRLKPITLH